MFAGIKRTFLFLKAPTMSRNSASLRLLSLGSSVVCVRSPVKTMKSGSERKRVDRRDRLVEGAFRVRIQRGSLEAQCVSES